MASLAEQRGDPKRVICLIGLPGAGKSTAAGLLERICGARRFHLPGVVGHLLPRHEQEYRRRHAILFSGVEDAFLSVVAGDDASVAVLDGFVRSSERLHLLDRTARERNWRVEVVLLATPGIGGLARTVLRQGLRDLRELDVGRIYRKVRRDLPVLSRIAAEATELGIPVHTVDALLPRESVERKLRSVLGYDPGSLPWDREVLRKVGEVAPDGWVTGGGHVYRPFYDHRFGPPGESWDVDIRVWGAPRAEEVQRELERRHPDRRWHVKDAASWARKEIGVELASVEESLARMALVCTCVGVRWRRGTLDLRWGHDEAERDLWNGVLRPNPGGQTGFARAKAEKIAAYYPAVSAPFIEHHPLPIVRGGYTRALECVRAAEQGGRRRWSGLAPDEQRFCERLVAFRNGLRREPTAVPWPRPAPFPEGDPWVAEDARFRVWVVNQARSRNPAGGRNPYLERALEVQSGGRQKATHQGWPLHLHALHATLEVDTDGVSGYRRCLRVAMLWHDVGKLWNVDTPGAHAAIGAKKWKSLQGGLAPPLAPGEEELVLLLIRWHDILGRLERGLWDPDYQGGMSPAEVRDALDVGIVPFRVMVRLVKETWRADVGSVPVLRWLKPLADPLERLILGDLGSIPPPGEAGSEGAAGVTL